MTDLSELAPLYRLTPPVVTAYVALWPDQPDAVARIDVAWKDLTRELVDRDVDPATIESILAAKPEPPEGAVTQVLVAAAGQVHLDRRIPAPPITPSLTVGTLPHLRPVISWQATRRAYVVVLADRAGAEVVAYPSLGTAPASDVEAETAEWPIHKTGAGGWAAKRYEATVEENWTRSAKRVAALVEKAARSVGPAVVVASGDERALSLLRDGLPERLRTELVVIPGGGRHADGADDLVGRRVEQAVAARVASDEEDVLARFAEAIGRGEGAVEGLPDVAAALQRGQVDTLIVGPGAVDDATLYYGPAATDVAVSPDALAGLGITDVVRACAVDVALRSAIESGSSVLTIAGQRDRAPTRGIGALLRYAG